MTASWEEDLIKDIAAQFSSGGDDDMALTSIEKIEVVSPQGVLRGSYDASFGGTIFVVRNPQADIRPGDEIRRKLPNGNDEVFFVEDPKFYSGGPFGSHYQVKISRRGAFPANTGGHYINVSGHNSHVNLGSTDNSINISSGNVFDHARVAVATEIKDAEQRAAITKCLDELEAANTQQTFSTSLQKLLATCADLVTVLTPFLPVMVQIMGNLGP